MHLPAPKSWNGRILPIPLTFLIAATLLTGFLLHAQQAPSAPTGGQPAAPSTSSQRAQSTPPTFSFEVATIKPAAPSPDGHTHINYPAGDRFSAQNITLLALLSWAFRLPQKQILDAPPWLSSTRFDLQAKLNAQDAPLNLSSEEDHARKREMLEALLADRCNLKLHTETRLLPDYELVLAKGGPRLQPSIHNGTSINTFRNHLDLQGLTPTLIAEQLSYVAGRIVVDKTNLTGRFDVQLRWTPDDAPATDPDAPPTLFTAIEEQLGLKLQPAKDPIPVLVIDHVDPPSAN